MGVLMMVGMVVSNSILIVEFTHRLQDDGMPLLDAVVNSCRIRLRPILMTSLATIIGLMPMALKLGTGSEAYAPLARAIIGGLTVSVVLTVFIVPAAYLLVYRRPAGAGAGGGMMTTRTVGVTVGVAAGARRRRAFAQTRLRCRSRTPSSARSRTIRSCRPTQFASAAARRGRPRGEVRVLPDRLRQRHRRRGARTAAASPPAA